MDITPGLEKGCVRTVSALTLSVRARFNATAPNYESGGQEFESLRARQHLAPSFRAKNYRFLRFLQGTEHARILRQRHSGIQQCLAPGNRGAAAVDLIVRLEINMPIR